MVVGLGLVYGIWAQVFSFGSGLVWNGVGIGDCWVVVPGLWLGAFG